VEARAIGKVLEERINRFWHEQLAEKFELPCYLEIEFETHFSRFLMPTIRGSGVGSKKRYAGLVEQADGETQLVFKGLESVRTDWTELAKDFQQALYDAVFHDRDPSALVRDTVAETLSGQRDHQLVYRKRLRQKLDQYVKNVPPHVRAARLADEHNKRNNLPLQYQRKGWISYVMTTNGPEPIEYRECPLDYDHYIERQLKPVADAVLPFAGLSFDTIMDKQLGLF